MLLGSVQLWPKGALSSASLSHAPTCMVCVWYVPHMYVCAGYVCVACGVLVCVVCVLCVCEWCVCGVFMCGIRTVYVFRCGVFLWGMCVVHAVCMDVSV